MRATCFYLYLGHHQLLLLLSLLLPAGGFIPGGSVLQWNTIKYNTVYHDIVQ